MELKKLTPSEYKTSAIKLYKENKKLLSSFNGFDNFNKKLLLGQNPFLQKKLKSTYFAGISNNSIQAICTFFESKEQSSLGQFLFSNIITAENIKSFLHLLYTELENFKNILIPMNGHSHFGFSSPLPSCKQTSFMTSCKNQLFDSVLYGADFLEKSREFHAYSLSVNDVLKEKIKNVFTLPNQEFTVRNISLLNFKHDIQIYNSLINQCMKGHYGFIPLNFTEEWELLKYSIFVLKPNYFKFLLHEGREIGFCFGIPDYNQILKNDSDLKNIIRLMTRKKQITKGRIIYSGILPLYRGRSLFKYVRHQVLQSMIDDGLQEIESSYIDEANISSQENAKSTGAQLSHKFNLYQFKR